MANVTYTVSTASQLTSVLAKATGGETILLAGGNYGGLQLSDYAGADVKFDTPITIKSASIDNPAVFTRLNMNGASNVTIDGVVFDYTFKAGDTIKTKPFEVTASSNIEIRNSVFDGDLAKGVSSVADGFGFAHGLTVRNSSNVSIKDNEFFDWHRGATFDNSKGIVVSGNDVHGIRSDGLNFSQVSNVRIEDNYIHDFKASPTSTDHRDMIQFWTTGTTKPSTDIVIRGNTLDIGDGSYTQSIFMRNEMVDSGGMGPAMFYQNVVIENNAIYNAHLHGITVGETNGLTIRNNSVLRVDSEGAPEAANGGGVWTPSINVKAISTNVVIEQNATGALNIGGTTSTAAWAIKNNAYVQDNNPHEPGYYGDQFISSTLTQNGTAHHYVIRPDSMLDKLGAGTSLQDLDPTPDHLTAYFRTTAEHDGDRSIVFDATASLGANGAAILGKAQFTWDFGDGSTATGLVVKHDFPKGGEYDVKLKITMPDGSSSLAHREVGIAGADVLSYDSAQGKFISQGYGDSEIAAGSIKSLVAVSGGSAVDLGGLGVQASVGKSEIGRLFNTDDFDISLKLQADSKATGWGEVLRVHTSLVGNVTPDGNFFLNLTTDNGVIHRLTTTGGTLNDGRVHSVDIDFDSANGTLKILVDGRVAASKAVTGELAGTGAFNLEFGNAWGKKNFEGKLLAFDLNVNNHDYPPGAVAQTSTLMASAPAPVAPTTTLTKLAVPETTLEPVVAPLSDAAAAKTAEPAGHEPLEGFQLDIAKLSAKALSAGAQVVIEGGVANLRLDGDGDYLNVGRLVNYEASDRLAFSVDFQRGEADGSTDRLVWNHQKVGLTLQGDGLVVNVATAAGQFKSFVVKDLGLNDTDLHQAVVLLDQTEDRLQIIVDDKLVLDDSSTDLQFIGAGGREAGWLLGTPWSRFFDGDVTDFRVSDSFHFLNEPVHVPDQSLVS